LRKVKITNEQKIERSFVTNYEIEKRNQLNLLNPLKTHMQNGSPKYHKKRKQIKRSLWR
jgi:hypothetical protein